MLPRRPNGLPSNPRSQSVGRNQTPPSSNYPRQQQPESRSRPRSRSRSRPAPSDSSQTVARYARSEVGNYSRSEAGSSSRSDTRDYARSEVGSYERSERSETRARARSRPRPPPSEPSHRYARSEVGGYTRPEAVGPSRRSDGSSASSGSSLFDRGRTGRGYESSRTSLEDDRSRDYRKRATPLSLRHRDDNRRVAQSEPPSPRYDSEPEPGVTSATSTGSGDGYNIWNRVTAAASNLTVSVSKAWASNITSFSGEETPVGGESRLTRAMKAYHAEKVTSPTELPAWLFDENERRPLVTSPSHKSSSSHSSSYGREDDYSRSEQSTRSRGLRDVYERAAANTANKEPPPKRAWPNTDVTSPTKATDRLRALRDAKRSAFTTAVVEQQEEPPQVEPPLQEVRQKRRVGLPSGPRPF